MGIRLGVYVVQYYEKGMSGQAGYSYFCSDCYEEAEEFAKEQNVAMLHYNFDKIMEGGDRPHPDASCQCQDCGEWKRATHSELREDGWHCEDCK
mgnify:CR=1 FL=1